MSVERLKAVGLRAAIYISVACFCLFSAFPFLVMLINTFKQDRDLYRPQNNPFFYNIAPTLANLNLLFLQTNFMRFVWNSLFIGVLVVIITLALSLPAAYSLARLTGRWGEQAGIAIFLVYLVPPSLLFIPLFRMVVAFGLNDSIWSLVLVYPTITIPFSTWLLMGFFKSIPRDMEEAARIDGASRMMAFFRIILPLSLSGIIAVIVFTFTLTLHEFVYAMVFITNSSQRTISVGVPIELVRGDVFFWQSLLAACLIVAIPVALIYNLFLDRLIVGFTMGAVKG
jgi:multiple sugar transport system permease protein